MRILEIIAEAPPIISGVSRVARELTDGLRRRGHEVDVVSSVDIPRLQLGEIRFSTLALRARKLWRMLPEYDIVHIHGPAPTFSDVALMLATGPLRDAGSVVYTYHSEIDFLTLPRLSALHNRMQKHIARRAAHTVVTTPSYSQLLRQRLPAENLSIVPWGVDVDAFHWPLAKPQDCHILFVGQLRPYKGLDVLLRAVRGLTGVTVHVVGTGHQADRYTKLAEQWQLDNVYFHGAAPASVLKNLYEQAHIVVLPSVTRAEAFGIVLLEAMAAGCVPVSSDLPGVADVVGRVGFTFPRGDHEALARLLAHLRDRPDVRALYGGLARRKAEFYSWERVIDAYERLFRRLYLLRLTTRTLHRTRAAETLSQQLLPCLMAATEADGACLAWGSEAHPLHTDACGHTSATQQSSLRRFVAREGRALLVPDDVEDTYLAEKQRPAAGGESAVVAPILADGQVLGVVEVARGAHRRPFEIEDVDWLLEWGKAVGPLLKECQVVTPTSIS